MGASHDCETAFEPGSVRRPDPEVDFHTHVLESVAAAAGLAHSVVTGFGTRQMPPAPPGSAQENAERAGYDPAVHHT